MNDCKCSKCGRIFSNDELVAMPYSDYPGGEQMNEYVSPCCFSGYKDEW